MTYLFHHQNKAPKDTNRRGSRFLQKKKLRDALVLRGLILSNIFALILGCGVFFKTIMVWVSITQLTACIDAITREGPDSKNGPNSADFSDKQGRAVVASAAVFG